MSVMFSKVDLRVSYILERIPDRNAVKIAGFRLNADGRILQTRSLTTRTVRRFLHDSSTTMAATLLDDWRAHLVWVMLQINVDFDNIPLRDHIRMDYEVWTPITESQLPDWIRHPLPPGPGCEVQ